MDAMQAVGTICVCQSRPKQANCQGVARTEVVLHKLLVLEGMLCADSHDGLVSVQRARRGLPSGCPPGHLLLQHVEERHDVAKTSEATLSAIVYCMLEVHTSRTFGVAHCHK